jgi:hypothetical protein
MPNVTGTVTELLYASTSPGTAKNTFTTEALINDTAGMGVQAHLPVDFLSVPGRSGIRILARGILSSTATPTYTPTIRLGASGTSGPIVLGGAALTTGSGVSNQFFEIEGDVILKTLGAAGANSTVVGTGRIISPGLATTIAVLYGGAATPGTVATVDTSIVNYINVDVACSASSASNTITLQQLLVWGLS